MKLDNLRTIDEMQLFLDGSQAFAFAVASSKAERYRFVENILRRFAYSRLKRRDKGVVIRFLIKVTTYSRQQLTRMIQRHNETGELQPQQKTSNGFNRVYTKEDIIFLAQVDQRHDTPNGFMIKKLCE